MDGTCPPKAEMFDKNPFILPLYVSNQFLFLLTYP